MDLLEALGASAPEQQQNGGWYTRRELCRALGLSENMMLERLRQLCEEGRIEVGKVKRTTISGVVFPTPAYRLKEPENGAESG